MSARIYRPRMAAELTIPVLGTRAQRIRQAASSDTVSLDVQVRRARWCANDFNHADELELELDWTEAGIDPRMLDDGTVALFLGSADQFGQWGPTVDNCRFIGTIDEVERESDGDSVPIVSIRATDFTTLFLKAKPFGSSGIPDLGMTLDEAWRLIVSQTPGAEILAARLFRSPDITSWPTLSKAVPSRFKKLGKVQTKPETDAWAVWQQCVGMLGLISWIDRDRCIVSTATNYYTKADPPRLVWGKNLRSLRETRNVRIAGNGVGLTSFDPTTNTVLEAVYPPDGDERIKRKRTKAKKVKQHAQATADAEKREWFSLPEVGTQEMLEEVAKRVYEERSRQELEGSASTSEMFVETVSGLHFDLLTLHAGDNLRVEFDDSDLHWIAKLPSVIARLKALKLRGYAPDAAELIAKNLEQITQLGAVFYVKSVTGELEFREHGGHFNIDVDFVNRILITGDAA